MAFGRSRRYRRYDDRPYRGGGGGGSGNCLRDACLIETGCCLGEALSDNCLILGVLLLPRTLYTVARAPSRAADGDGPLLKAIRTYQTKISAKRETPCCRFTPSCSHYAAEAIQRHGSVRGTWLASRRLLRCRPGGARGDDPVPG